MSQKVEETTCLLRVRRKELSFSTAELADEVNFACAEQFADRQRLAAARGDKVPCIARRQVSHRDIKLIEEVRPDRGNVHPDVVEALEAYMEIPWEALMQTSQGA
ncbi:MAG: hypothetical protein HY914_10195 [Desulfomonile tiedjei]|nr:hypothetical protein [Desulfomonile tiedjei]